MIPTTAATAEEVTNDFDTLTESVQPSKTYHLDLETMRVQGHTDGKKAMEQAIYKILQTERYEHPEVYSNNYASELRGLIGMPIPYVLPESERRIKEAVEWDDRVNSVGRFTYEVVKNRVHVTFPVYTIFGVIEISTEVAT